MSNAETLLKERYVEEWVRHGDPFKAALALYPYDSGMALKISATWPLDPEVLSLRRAIGCDETGLIPSREELISKVMKAAEEAPMTEDKLKGFRLVSEMCGYIQKPEIAIDNRSITVNNRVMAVRDHGSDEEWEQRLAEQQRSLTSKAGQRAN